MYEREKWKMKNMPKMYSNEFICKNLKCSSVSNEVVFNDDLNCLKHAGLEGLYISAW